MLVKACKEGIKREKLKHAPETGKKKAYTSRKRRTFVTHRRTLVGRTRFLLQSHWSRTPAAAGEGRHHTPHQAGKHPNTRTTIENNKCT